jgi:DNA-binding transcriptional MerR regulator
MFMIASFEEGFDDDDLGMEEYSSPRLSFRRDKMYFTIGEVSELVGVADSTLRFWEKQFPFFAPKKSEGKTRYYTKKDIKNIHLLIYLLKERKFTIEGAKKLLKEDRKNIEKKHVIVMKLKKIKTEIHSLRLAFESHLDLSEVGEINRVQDGEF